MNILAIIYWLIAIAALYIITTLVFEVLSDDDENVTQIVGQISSNDTEFKVVVGAICIAMAVSWPIVLISYMYVSRNL